METGVRQAKRRQTAIRGEEKRAQRTEESRDRKYMAWKHLTRNQKEVARRMAHGERCDYVHDGSWGFF